MIKKESYVTKLIQGAKLSDLNLSAFSRWSYGIVMWEIFTIGKYGQKHDRTDGDALYLT